MSSQDTRPAPPAGVTAHYILFVLSGQTCALPRQAVRELLPLPRLSRPPFLPAALAGFVNLGGEPLPVLALARLLGLAEAPAAEGGLYRHIVVVQEVRPGAATGLLVDRVLDLLTAPAAQIRPARPEESLNGCVVAGLARPEGFLPVLDPARILMAREQASLEELTRRAATRLEDWTV